MANANQIKALLKSHAEGDEEWFYSIAMQLLAYHTSNMLGRDVDQPRNLAKSVTVE